jgi:hypothetical protein
MKTLPCLSIRQPWAWLIVQGIKPVENRTWPTTFRGRLLIHAGKTLTRAYYDEVGEQLAPILPAGVELPPFEAMQLGGVIGEARITDCVTDHPSPLFTGPHAFVMASPRARPFVPYRGLLGFFNVPASLLASSWGESAC